MARHSSHAGMVAAIGSLVKDLPGVRASYAFVAIRARRVGRSVLGPQEHAAAPHRSFAVAGHHVSCGYYDVSPFDAKEELLLATSTPGPNSPADGRPAGVGYFALEESSPSFHALGRTTSWSWQLGPRLQWMDPDSRHIIYNQADAGRPAAVIVDASSGRVVEKLPMFIFSILPRQHVVLSLNFARLFLLRPGYGYPGLPGEGLAQKAPDDDGLWRFDLGAGRRELVLSLAEISSLDSDATMEGATHYINHIQPNPSGTRVSLLHVWLYGDRRRIRLITCSPDGKDACALINDGHVSHSCWRSDAELLAFSTHPETGRGLHLYSDRSARRRRLFVGSVERDGHPSFFPDGARFAMDGYPDVYSDQSLSICDLRSEAVTPIGRFYSPASFAKEVRCDLHPRVSPTGRFVAIDSPLRGVRAVHVVDVGDR